MEARRTPFVEPAKELQQNQTRRMNEGPHGPHEVVQQMSKKKHRTAKQTLTMRLTTTPAAGT